MGINSVTITRSTGLGQEAGVPVPQLRGSQLEEGAPMLTPWCEDPRVLSPHLEGVEEEGEEHLDVAQDARGLLVGGKDEDNFVDPKEGDERQRGFGQPEKSTRGAGPFGEQGRALV